MTMTHTERTQKLIQVQIVRNLVNVMGTDVVLNSLSAVFGDLASEEPSSSENREVYEEISLNLFNMAADVSTLPEPFHQTICA